MVGQARNQRSIEVNSPEINVPEIQLSGGSTQRKEVTGQCNLVGSYLFFRI